MRRLLVSGKSIAVNTVIGNGVEGMSSLNHFRIEAATGGIKRTYVRTAAGQETVDARNIYRRKRHVPSRAGVGKGAWAGLVPTSVL